MTHEHDKAKQYHQLKLNITLLDTVLGVAYAVAWILWSDDLPLGESRWLGLWMFAALFAAGYEILTLPLSYYSGYILEHRFGMSNQTPGRWFSQTAKGWAVGGLLGGILMSGLFAILWYTGPLWWLWVWIAWIGVTVVLAQLAPVVLLPIFFKSEPLENDDLASRFERLALGTTLKVEGIYRLALSEDTKAANAMLTGLGGTRRVYLSDTLLDAFTPDEIEVVFAHELGHHTRGHIWKLLGLGGLFGTALIGALAVVLEPTRTEAWIQAVVAIPAVVLAATAIDLLIKPIHNAVSRRFEHQCDSDALQRTGNPAAYRSAFERLAEMNLADPDPPAWVEWYFHDHPAMSRRIAMADAV
jgi:STE24 endopeptidase